MYNVIDAHTATIVGSYKTYKRASAAANRKDMQYGACRYVVEVAF